MTNAYLQQVLLIRRTSKCDDDDEHVAPMREITRSDKHMAPQTSHNMRLSMLKMKVASFKCKCMVSYR